jgi:hypothetical protein
MFEPRSKRFSIGCVKCIELAHFSHNFVRMTLVCTIRAENKGVFPSLLDGFQKHIELGQFWGFGFRLAIEVKFGWYSFDKACLVSTICIRGYSNVSTSLQTVQYWMCEMHRISAVFTSFWTCDFGLQNYGRKWGYFPITSWRLIKTHWIRSNLWLWLSFTHGSEVRLTFARKTLFGFKDMYSGVFERLNLVPNGSILDVWNASNEHGFIIILYVWIWFAKLGPKTMVFSHHIFTALKNTLN